MNFMKSSLGYSEDVLAFGGLSQDLVPVFGLGPLDRLLQPLPGFLAAQFKPSCPDKFLVSGFTVFIPPGGLVALDSVSLCEASAK